MRLLPSVLCVFVGAVLFAVPNMSRRETLFAVPVPPDFRKSPEGRRAISIFRFTIVAVVLAGICAIQFSPARLLNATVTAVPIVMLVVCGISFYWQNRKLTPAAIQYTRPHEAEISVAPESLPRYVWLGAGPFIILAAVALWLHLHWNLIPTRFPVHFNASGQPNRWAEKTIKGVYGPLFFGAELCAWILIMALACWFGSRRLRSRSVVLGSLIALQYFLVVTFVLVAVQAPLGIPVTVIVLAPMAILLPLLIVMTKKMGNLGDPMDATPNECWKGAILYYNPNDAALFVEKRDGVGFTFNFANPWSWVLLSGLVVVIASAHFVLA